MDSSTAKTVDILLIETRKVLDKLGPHGTTIISKLEQLRKCFSDSGVEPNEITADLMADFTECSQNLTTGEYKFFVETLQQVYSQSGELKPPGAHIYRFALIPESHLPSAMLRTHHALSSGNTL